MRVGFTGTREGLTVAQQDAIERLLTTLYPTHAHHGDCIGADEEFHGLVFQALWLDCRRVVHPPKDERLRAFCEADEYREPKDYIPRNRDIADETDALIAAPNDMEPPASLKGHGTWSTYFYAKDKAQKRVYLVTPDGAINGGHGD